MGCPTEIAPLEPGMLSKTFDFGVTVEQTKHSINTTNDEDNKANGHPTTVTKIND